MSLRAPSWRDLLRKHRSRTPVQYRERERPGAWRGSVLSEAQVAHAPRTVPTLCQIPIRRPFSSAVANRRFMDYSAVKNEFSRRDLAEKTRSCRLATQRPRGLEGCQKAIAHPVATARLSGWMIYRREPARLAHVILGRDRSGRKRNIAAW